MNLSSKNQIAIDNNFQDYKINSNSSKDNLTKNQKINTHEIVDDNLVKVFKIYQLKKEVKPLRTLN